MKDAFNTRKQNDTENIDDYVTWLKLLASNCEYAVIEESLIKDMLVIGINDKKLRENMLLDISFISRTFSWNAMFIIFFNNLHHVFFFFFVDPFKSIENLQFPFLLLSVRQLSSTLR